MSEVSVNFDNVEVPEKQVSKFKVVTKGAKELTITNVEDGTSTGGTPFINVTFYSEVDEASFPHKFYLSRAALPRVQSLMIGFTGKKLAGEVDTAFISAQLVGKISNCIVDEKVVSKESNGKVYNNAYPELRFADFANLTTPFKDSDARSKDETAPASVKDAVSFMDDNSTIEEDNLPW